MNSLSVSLFSFFLLVVAVLAASKSSVKQTPSYIPPINGYSNNIKHPDWGSANSYFFREAEPYYKNITAFVPYDDVNSRNISNWLLDDFSVTTPSEESLSVIGMVWGQFLTHDVMLTLRSSEIRYIQIPDDDQFFPVGYRMPFPRTNATYVDGVPSVVNRQTSFLDGSTVYGFNSERLGILRNGTSAFMRTHNGEGLFLPFNSPPDISETISMDNDPQKVTIQNIFAAGDLRASENPVLASLHTLFLREHNRRAAEFLQQGLSDEEAFQEARRWVIAHIQAINFYEYYPVVIGEPMEDYPGYNSSINPNVGLFFGTSAFRYGHSEAPEMFLMLDEHREPIAEQPTISTFDGYFYPPWVLKYNLDPILRGAAAQVALNADLTYTSAIRNFLFGVPGRGGFDLGVFNIERNRDHGIPPYNEMRRFYGLTQFDSFDTFPASPDLRERMKIVYGNDISKLDAYIGGLAESKSYPRSVVGDLFRAAIKAEYHKMREGNRFHFENADAGFTAEQIQEIKSTKLANIILRNTNISSIQCSVLVATYNLDCSKNAIVPTPIEQASLSALDGTYNLSWTFPDDKHITFEMRAETTGWVGMSFPLRQGYMLNADAIIGWVSGNTVNVHDYYIDSSKEVSCPSGVCLDTRRGGLDSITNVNGSEKDGITTIKFTRPLAPSDTSDREIVLGSSIAINVAFGPADQLGYHVKKGGLLVDLKSGAASTVSLDRASIRVHGILMFIAWAVIFPLGILIVRFGKQVLPAWWFRGHMFLQFAGLIIVLLALMFAIHYISNKGSSHFVKVHEQLGLATILLSIITPALGQITAVTWKGEREEIPFFPDKLHWILGYISILMAFANFGLGLHDYRSAPVIWGLCYAWVGLVTAGYIVFYIYNSRQLVSFGSDSDKSDKL